MNHPTLDDTRNSQRIWLLLTTLIMWASFWKAPYPREIWLQHIPTVAGLICLGWLIEGQRLRSSSVVCLLLFTGLHLIGARWIYSYVPYDRWCEQLVGVSISKQMGWSRNHYDRLVHFMSGVLFVPVAWDSIRRQGVSSLGLLVSLSVSVVLAIGAIYEILEWGVAMTLAPHYAESYNGQQGDLWDAQKDLALAGLGGIFSASWMVMMASSATPVPALEQAPREHDASSRSPEQP